MFKITCKASPDQLAEVLTNLHKTVNEVQVERLDNGAASHRPIVSQRPKLEAIPGPASKPAKVKARRGRPRDGALQAKAKALIDTAGHKFALTDLMSRAKAEGVTPPTVYRAIRLEMAAGRLRKLVPGQYQRSAQSFASSMGFSG